MLHALRAGHALDDDLGVAVEKDGHVVSSRPLLRGQLGGLGRGAVHGLFDDHERVRELAQDPAALVDVVAVEPDDERLGRLVTDRLEGADDAVGDGVTGGDATEDVDEHRLDLWVAEDDVQPVGHHLGARAAADVEEVRRLAADRLTGVGDDVEGRHDEAGAVADDADVAVELDVVEPLLLGGGLQGVRRGGVLECRVVRVAEVGVAVEGHLAVEGDDVAALGLDEGVDLDERRVLTGIHVPESLQDRNDLAGRLGVEAGGVDDLLGLRGVDAGVGVDVDAGQRLGPLDGELLDLHAALLAAHREVGAVGAVEEEGEVVLLGDRGALGDHHPVDRVALDVHAEDLAGELLGLLGALGDLHAAGLAAATCLDLGLDDGDPAALRTDRLGSGPGLGGCLGDGSGEHGDPVLLEDVSGLVLVEIHGGIRPSSVGGRGPAARGGPHRRLVPPALGPGSETARWVQSHDDAGPRALNPRVPAATVLEPPGLGIATSRVVASPYSKSYSGASHRATATVAHTDPSALGLRGVERSSRHHDPRIRPSRR
ncbi:Predicted hydrolase or acyltransferase (modular protein) [Nostocoides japonicum T1-X7]|uniref:Predicted hydrolase or acyltransferase (Modular protein) n=1 Tax=Nostocoides japonicum T1-X7 TaxID=1194083 RepID=A0A077LYN8_9MICO|nr:Predicted hydrolase or acyltransferase (modular protein) [Tetrasphaera japonica T1-X7]